MKKVLSLFLALLFCLSLSVPALASQNELRVTSVEELWEALGPDTRILLAPGEYLLDRPLRLDGTYRGLTLCAENPAEAALLLAENASAPVIELEGTEEITFEHLYIAHQEGAEAPTAPIIRLSGVSGLTLRDCELFGGGTRGLDANGSSGLLLDGCVIRDCAEGILRLGESDALFSGCTFSNNGAEEADRAAIELSTSALTLDNCLFRDNPAPHLFNEEQYDPEEGFAAGSVTVSLSGCSFTGNGWPAAESRDLPEIPVTEPPETEPVAGFEDVTTADYFAEAVSWAVVHDVTEGTAPGFFSPQDRVSRSEALTFLWRANGSPEPRTAGLTFDDVPADTWYTKAVLWAVENGITRGTGDRAFSPAVAVSRDQVLTFLCRGAGISAGGADWSDTAMNWARANGLTKGIPGPQLGKDICPRCDVVYYLWKQLGES